MKDEVNVNAKYWPQCIPRGSNPFLSNSEFDKTQKSN